MYDKWPEHNKDDAFSKFCCFMAVGLHGNAELFTQAGDVLAAKCNFFLKGLDKEKAKAKM